MVAAFLEFDHGPASVAALPPFLLRLFEKPARLFIFWALSRMMPPPIAETADLRLASATFPALPAVFAVDILGFNPFSTPPRRAIHPVSGGILCELLVPRLLEVVVKQILNMSQRDVFGGAAFGGHVLGVCYG
jgi:hypothetical protein